MTETDSPLPSPPDVTSADAAATSIREMILEGHFMPGDRLHQDHLAETLGVSRTPLRTALARLAQDGLIDYEPNRGYRIRRFLVSDIREAFTVRANLEGLACRLAAEAGMSTGDLDRLQALVAEGDAILFKGALPIDQLPAYRRMNVEFHETIIAAAGNRWIGRFVHQSHNVPLVSDRVILWDDFGVIHRSHDDHRRIAGALADRDGVRAQNLMNEHVTYAGQLLADRLEADPSATLRHAFHDKKADDRTRPSTGDPR
ncbi:GntR family transcriptional regulator [Nitratireductor sp. ZSWI3]|uniref:GntR family transcriptional regulator n=1 Tax=Nitratireductor sp. ZSWI3 TaxID=2966359 RepID=UPI002150578A|nr:GntR family transcriptional regulator [Nitratireductor sp. ZSWI3]MCR4268724.1 GntR family transcriptional regulator [Nitratireductor sp. ZSWI3]